MGVVPEVLIAIDWSGRQGSDQKKHIWAGVWEHGVVQLVTGKTRNELCVWLIEQARKTPKLVAGVDFCFSYPEWFVREHGASSAPEFWQIVLQHGEKWLARECEDARFWGKPKKKPPEFCGDAGTRRMLRLADCECKLLDQAVDPESIEGIAPKSPFQIGGAGAVGTGTLRGIPLLPGLQAGGFAVWPFDLPRLPVLLEIYPRLLTGKVRKSVRDERVRYLRENVASGVLTPHTFEQAAGSEDAFDAAVSALRMGECRIEFAQLRRLTEPIRQMEGKVWRPGVR